MIQSSELMTTNQAKKCWLNFQISRLSSMPMFEKYPSPYFILQSPNVLL